MLVATRPYRIYAYGVICSDFVIAKVAIKIRTPKSTGSDLTNFWLSGLSADTGCLGIMWIQRLHWCLWFRGWKVRMSERRVERSR